MKPPTRQPASPASDETPCSALNCALAAEYRKAVAVLEAIENRYMDGCDTYEDWKAMGELARGYFLAHSKETPTTEDSSAVEAVREGWIPHKPGNPMPCEGGSRNRIRLRNGVVVTTKRPEDFEWGEIPYHTDEEIIAWKPAE